MQLILCIQGDQCNDLHLLYVLELIFSYKEPFFHLLSFCSKNVWEFGTFQHTLEQLLANHTGSGMQIEHDEGVAPKPRKLLNVLYSPVAIQVVQFQWANTSLWNHIYFKVFKNTGSAFMDLYFALQGAGEFFSLLISQLRRRRKTLNVMARNFARRKTQCALCCSKWDFKRSEKTGKRWFGMKH